MSKYSITYNFSQNYNNSYIFDFFKNEKTMDYIKELEIVDSIVKNEKDYKLALDLIEKCKKI